MALAHPELDQSGKAGYNLQQILASDLVITGYTNVTSSISASVPTYCIMVPIFFVSIMVFALRHLILKNLSQYHLISEEAKRLHREYLKVKRGYFLKMDRKFQALTFQSLLPLLYLISTCFFMLDFFTQLHSPVVEYGFVFTASLVPCLSLFCSFLCITPLRVFLCSLFKCNCFRKEKVHSANSTITHGT